MSWTSFNEIIEDKKYMLPKMKNNYCECRDRIKDKNIYYQIELGKWFLSFKYGNYLLIKIKLDEGCPYCRLPLPNEYRIVAKQYARNNRRRI